MKVICPGHYCVLETQDKIILESYQVQVKTVASKCPYCNEELFLLNILIENVSYCSPLAFPETFVEG
jgi:aspartate carbamoyltransferase regulatory subunit